MVSPVSPFELRRRASDLLDAPLTGAQIRATLNMLIEEGVAARVGRMMYALAGQGAEKQGRAARHRPWWST